MRSIWKGAISFGLVNIPVKLYSATQQSNLDLDMVDKRDMGKIRYHRVNENSGKEVPSESIGKAYNLEGQYVMLDDTDFAEAEPEKSKIIEVNHFINEKEIDTIYFENSYYVEPEKSGEKAYALLREALTKSGKVGIAQFVLRSTEALTVLKPKGNIIVLSKIRFAEEIRSTEQFNLPDKSIVKPNEMKMALTLIDQYTGPFNIEEYKDEYAHALLERIKAKASGKRGKVRKLQPAERKTEDLMAALKASLAKKKVS